MKPLFVSIAILLSVSAGASAQSADLAGVRARGMGGAFTAVADDVSATWWNPAGLAGGAYASAVLEYGRLAEPSEIPGNVTGIAAGFPALGLSYYRFRISEMRRSAATAAPAPSRQDGGTAGIGLLTLTAAQLGATVGQSIGDHLVVATTLKWVHGGPEGGSATNAATLDLGALATFGGLRVGVAVRNVTEPTLGEGADAGTLDRTARAGAAFTFEPGGPAAVTVAADADLTTNQGAASGTRHLAGGTEVWFVARRVGLRAGITVNTTGDARPTGSVGGSVAVKSGIYVDAGASGGDDPSLRGWSAALRVTF